MRHRLLQYTESVRFRTDTDHPHTGHSPRAYNSPPRMMSSERSTARPMITSRRWTRRQCFERQAELQYRRFGPASRGNGARHVPQRRTGFLATLPA